MISPMDMNDMIRIPETRKEETRRYKYTDANVAVVWDPIDRSNSNVFDPISSLRSSINTFVQIYDNIHEHVHFGVDYRINGVAWEVHFDINPTPKPKAAPKPKKK